MTPLSHAILLAEDNPDDVFAFKRTLKIARIRNPLQIVINGREAIDYLAGTEKYADREKYPLPFLLFLDLTMPDLDGFGVLAWIREQPRLESLVVVVLSGSEQTSDYRRAYELGARSYLVKPPNAEDLQQFIVSMGSRWGHENGLVLRETGDVVG